MITSDEQGHRRHGARKADVRRHLPILGLAGSLAGIGMIAAGFTFRDGLAGPGPGGSVDTPARTARAIASPRPAAAPPAPRPAAGVRIAAVGDVVMGTLPDGLPPDDGASFFDPVDDLIAGDVVLGNLEGTLTTGGPSKCDDDSPNCFAFRTPPSYGLWFKKAGFTVMNLANNHIDDFGAEGRRQTFAALRAADLPYTGRAGQITLQRVHGIRVAVIGFAPDEGSADLTDIPAAKRLTARAAAMADIVIVTMHAGAEGADHTHVEPGTEYFLGEDRGDAHRFSRAVIDAGADLVVGSGPHVMRGMEFYKGRLIAYSLGNFAGYEVFGLGGVLSTSGVLHVTLNADGTYASGRLHPTQIVAPGTPEPGGDGIDLVAELSEEDFGPHAARISPDGTIHRP
ncbi:CapA family protein [Streptomyces sp. NPDC048514]|uniref:CapA family protein n=1 Tax=Streptomyces sp. NPDC048514 TaxID=3365564 RepID=UPI00371BF098